MRKKSQFILLLVLVFIGSCKPLDYQLDNNQLISERLKPAIPQTKGANNESDEFLVSISDAECYLAVHRPEESYSITPYIVSGDTLFYFVNFNEGWMILSRDRRTVPVVAESLDGTLDINPDSGYNVWLRKFYEDLEAMNNSIGENEYSKNWKAILHFTKKNKMNQRDGEWKWVIREGVYGEQTTIIDTIPNMIQTTWGNQSPWNNNYPIDTRYNERCKTGYVAVAVAQVLYYWHYHFGIPTQLSHTVSCNSTISQATPNIGFTRADITFNSGRWNDMALSSSSGGNTTYVGDFILDIGNRVNMVYSGTSSLAALDTTAFTSMASYYGIGFNPCSPYSKSAVKSCLFSGYPVIMGGYPSTNSFSWHAWIIDGFYIERQNYSMLRYCEYSTNWGINDEVYDTFEEAQAVYGFSGPYDFIPFTRIVNLERFHMNWGDDGNGDGIFLCSGGWDCPINNTVYSSSSPIVMCYFYNL